MQDHFIMAPLRAEKSAQHMAATEDFDSSRRSWDAQRERHVLTFTFRLLGQICFQILDPKWSQPSKNLLLLADVLQVDLLHWHDCECNTCVSAKSTSPPTQIQEVCQLFRPTPLGFRQVILHARLQCCMSSIFVEMGCKHRTSAQSR